MAFDPEQEQETNHEAGGEEAVGAAGEHEFMSSIEDAVSTGEVAQAHTIKVGSAG
jgi:hypothetical protein